MEKKKKRQKEEEGEEEEVEETTVWRLYFGGSQLNLVIDWDEGQEWVKRFWLEWKRISFLFFLQ